MSTIFDPDIASRQKLACAILQTAVEKGKLMHAYLLTGRAQKDKCLIAKALACYLNCSNGPGTCARASTNEQLGAADFCQNCKWIWQDAHPQALLTLGREDSKSGRMAVEKARLLSQELAKTSAYARVIVIPEAQQDVFHRPAANALLKTLEEPGLRCLFFLFATEAEAVLPTVVSRCQLIPMSQQQGFEDGFLSDELSDSCRELLPLVRAQLFSQAGSGQSLSPVAAQTGSLSRTLEWAQKLQHLSDSQIGPLLLLDLVVAEEVKHMRASGADNPALSWYLNELLQLAESTKEQIEHYVQPKAAIESFALSCRKLNKRRRREPDLE